MRSVGADLCFILQDRFHAPGNTTMLRVPQSPVNDFNSPPAPLHGFSARRQEAGLKGPPGHRWTPELPRASVTSCQNGNTTCRFPFTSAGTINAALSIKGDAPGEKSNPTGQTEDQAPPTRCVSGTLALWEL